MRFLETSEKQRIPFCSRGFRAAHSVLRKLKARHFCGEDVLCSHACVCCARFFLAVCLSRASLVASRARALVACSPTSAQQWAKMFSPRMYVSQTPPRAPWLKKLGARSLSYWVCGGRPADLTAGEVAPSATEREGEERERPEPAGRPRSAWHSARVRALRASAHPAARRIPCAFTRRAPRAFCPPHVVRV